MDKKISSQINVLEVTADLAYRGGQRNMVSFAKYLRQDLFKVVVGVYREGGPLESVLKTLGIPVVIGNGSVEPLLEVIKNQAIDILHIHRSGRYVAIETELIKRAKKINPNLIVVEKNVFGKFDPTLDGIVDCSLFQSMMHLNERYLPASNKKFDFGRQKVFYNIVDDQEFSRYQATPGTIYDYKKRIGIKPDAFVVGKVAQPALEKWSDLLIEMVPYLVKLVPNIQVAIIGCPPSRIRRIERSQYKDYFILLPQNNDQNELHLFYQAINVMAHSSKIGECNGNTINEAMFWKKPVVTNSTPRKDNGQLEQVIHSLNGFIANTPPTFARALAYLAVHTEECKKMGLAGFEQVSTINNPRSIVHKLEKLFIEKVSQKMPLRSLPEADEYANISYIPDEKTILSYHQEYQSRLRWEYGSMSASEQFFQYTMFPTRFYFKVKDFIQHKWQSYGKR